jgi:hypothetical protein
MQEQHSRQSDNRGRVTRQARKLRSILFRRATSIQTPLLPGLKSTWSNPALLVGSPLARQLVLALHAKGVNATVTPGESVQNNTMVCVPAVDKDAAVEVILQALEDVRPSPEARLENFTTLTA